VVMDIGANIGTFALFAAQCGASCAYSVALVHIMETLNFR